MPDEKPTQQEQHAAASNDPTGPAQPLTPRNQANPEARDSGNRATETARHHNNPDKVKNWLMVIFTGVIAAVTIVYSYFAYGQWTAMEKTLHESVKTREVENRAYVEIQGISADQLIANGEDVALEIVLENTGKTPARHVRNTFLLAEFFDSEPSDVLCQEIGGGERRCEFNVGNKLHKYKLGYEPFEASLPPGNNYPMHKTFNKPSAEDLPAIQRNELRLYVLGIFEYDDVFGIHRKTPFCFVNEHSNQPRFSGCDHNNNPD